MAKLTLKLARPTRVARMMALGLLLTPPTAASTQILPQADSVREREGIPAVADSLLESRLRAIFDAIEDFSGVSASVTGGVVRLAGTVNQPDDRRRVEELATSLSGVVYVLNQVEASTEVQTRVAPAMAKIREYWDVFVAQLPVAAVALLVALVFGLLAYLVGQVRRPASWTGINPLVWGFLSRLLRGALAGIGLLLAFDVLGITSLMGAVLGTAGIVGLAIGFAFQDIVENYLAGMLLSLRRPFSVNDLVRVGEFEGQVIRLTSRETVLMTFEGNHVRLPNAHVFKNPLVNFTINPRRLFSFDVGIGMGEDLQTAIEVGVETLRAMRGVMGDPPPFARVIELGDWSVKIRYHAWVDQRLADFLKVRSEAIRLVKASLDLAQVEMPEPVYRTLTGPLPERSRAPVRERPDPAAEAGRIDVDPDRKLDAQVREDLEASEDENLLEK